MRLTKEDILSRIKENEEILEKFGVKRIGIFGSYIRNEQTEESDIDIIVEFEEDKRTFDNFINLAFFLEDLFEKRVDLLTLESISPYIKSYIDEEIVYERI
jgi:hypothetical protein